MGCDGARWIEVCVCVCVCGVGGGKMQSGAAGCIGMWQDTAGYSIV